MVVGDEVAFSQATEATVKVAETLGIRVFGAPMYSNNPFPTAHPLWAGMLPPQATAIRATLTNIDRVFLIGGRAFMVYPYSPGSALPTGSELLHLSPDPLQLGRAYATRLGIVGDLRATLEALLPLLQTRVDSEQAQVAIAHARTAYEARQTDLELQVQRQVSKVPMPPVVAAHALIRALPPDTIVVDEAPIATNEVRAFHRVHSASRYFFCRGGGLGWGMPAALGISLGYDREPVLCVVGDGSALYSPQALWTAMHEQLPVVFVVINNRGYGILKDALRTMYEHHPQARPFVGMDIIDPPIDFVALSRSMGVASTRVERVNEVGDAVRTALVTGKPHLIEIVLA
jgi:benzoylformate decarboxylase